MDFLKVLRFNRCLKKNTVDDQSVAKRFSFCAAVNSDIGCVRKNNEDNFLVGYQMNENSSEHFEALYDFSQRESSWYVAGVFDGMGGGEDGEVASRLAASTVLDMTRALKPASSRQEMDTCMRSAFQKANDLVFALKKSESICGTTATVLCSDGIAFKIYHLGDSRAYLLRANDLKQLSCDQTVWQMKRELGLVDEQETCQNGDVSRLTEYIGRDWTGEGIFPQETEWIPIQEKDCILLCSDGLYHFCEEDQIQRMLPDGGIENAAASLVACAISAGGTDNVTCIIGAFSRT